MQYGIESQVECYSVLQERADVVFVPDSDVEEEQGALAALTPRESLPEVPLVTLGVGCHGCYRMPVLFKILQCRVGCIGSLQLAFVIKLLVPDMFLNVLHN